MDKLFSLSNFEALLFLVHYNISIQSSGFLLKSLPLILLLLASQLFIGCGSTKQIHEKNLFSFMLNGENYEIISMNTESGEGGNLLILRKENRIDFSAQDLNQDGLIDTILKGDVELEEANAIYWEGIRIARNKGLYKEKEGLRTFEWKSPAVSFVLQSYIPTNNSDEIFFNRFSLYLMNEDVISIDRNADGILDEVEKGSVKLDSLQTFYTEALEIGIRAQRIIQSDGRFIVLINNPRL